MAKSGVPKNIVFIFLDGVGIGRNDPAINPFFAEKYPTLLKMFDGRMLDLGNPNRSSNQYTTVSLDARLGVEGFPQSGTGQTALLTGINASKEIGKHFGPYPYSTLRPLLKEHNIFARLYSKGIPSLFANAFPQRYFDYVEKKPIFIGANALAWLLSGFQLNTHEDLAKGNALSADITQERWKDMGYPEILPITPFEAGKRLVALTEKYRFVYFEYYLTDKAGHSQSMPDAIAALKKIDLLLAGVLEHIDTSNTLLIITSDHGNMEDLSVRTHTLNPVPLIAAGAELQKISDLNSLTDVAPFILDQFT